MPCHRNRANSGLSHHNGQLISGPFNYAAEDPPKALNCFPAVGNLQPWRQTSVRTAFCEVGGAAVRPVSPIEDARP